WAKRGRRHLSLRPSAGPHARTQARSIRRRARPRGVALRQSMSASGSQAQRIVLIAVILAAYLTQALDVRADDPSAARAIEVRAREAFALGNYEEAAGRFGEAFRLSPRAATKYN